MADFNLEHVKCFRFTQLFVDDLGWDRSVQQQPYTVVVGEDDYVLGVLAHKRGVQLLHCQPDAQGRIPAYATRQKIERKVTAQAREHLIVFTDAAQTAQVWQWVARVPGKPVQYRELHYRKGDAAELLKQKLSRLRFTLNEEELLTVLGVVARLEDAIPRDKVTKKFYTEFKKQRDAFEQFVEGIPKLSEDLHWYAAVLIDRLMFIWFLQEKQFLDGKKRYLQDRLAAHQASSPTRSFYKEFLCPLFFRGFAQERNETNRAQLAAEFGQVPYLNGGLFSQHELEARYGDTLDVADAALEKLFRFFDDWEWHLDDRPLKNDREINPDVLGYIFEKFVNQKQMGAYYTKEDITEYIGKNTIIPALLHKVRSKHPGAFDALAWPLLQADPDRYVYPAMLKGVDLAYPAAIEAGRETQTPDLQARRKGWNSKTPEAWALPTEIWRETIARHDRTREVRAKLAAGEVAEIGDLITYNLDIRRFAQDLIERCADAALLREFWAVLAGRVPRKSGEKFRPALSVLDPTCGSGAFLFAALNILKPLYDAALGTMAGLLLDADQASDHKSAEKWKDLEETVNRFSALGSDRARDYAVVKHIVVHNLYGVDIEEQATEIAKLRLFLKLVSLLEPGDHIEPLPDIDFNIRHGNTLVGYATADETEAAVKGATQGNLFSDAWEDIRIRLIAVEEAFNNFQIQQVQRGGHVTAQDKQALSAQLGELEEMLNFHLCRAYGKDPTKGKQYEAWKASHKPFHWYADFYPLMTGGGFDAVIGNPPFVELAKVKGLYSVLGYSTEEAGNLYGLCLERLRVLCGAESHSGFVVPIAAGSVGETASVRVACRGMYGTLWASHFAIRPTKLFEGVEQRLTVLIAKHGKELSRSLTTKYHQWFTDEREHLFARLAYVGMQLPKERGGAWPKIGSHIESSILQKLGAAGFRPASRLLSSGSPWLLYFHRTPGYWIRALDFLPFFESPAGDRSIHHIRELLVASEESRNLLAATVSSSLYFWWFFALGNCRNLTKSDVLSFPTPRLDKIESAAISNLFRELMSSYRQHSVIKQRAESRYQEFDWVRAKPAVDAIDYFLASHFGLNDAEVDFVVNYDIKIRVGADAHQSDD